MKVRRVVTSDKNGKSIIISDTPAPRTWDYVHAPGMSTALVWATDATPALPHDGRDLVDNISAFVPAPGESRLAIVTMPPENAVADHPPDPAALSQEFEEQLPGFLQAYEPDNPGMHKTDTIDYGIVLEGEVWLEVDDGQQVLLKPHDIAIQNGTRHAWRNKSEKSATVAFILIGAKRNK